MKKRIVILLAAAMAVICAQADTWTDPDTGYTWTYTVSGDTAQIYKGNNSSSIAISPSPTGTLTIPSQLNGKTVTSIGNYAFCNCSGLTNVSIPNRVTSIGNYAFSGCSGLIGTLTIPECVTSIGTSAFSGCAGFTGPLTIPESVTNIGASAFFGCTGFTGALTIPNGMTIINPRVFEGCRGFTGQLTIPNTVTNIGYGAFQNCSGLTGELVVPGSVKKICGETVNPYTLSDGRGAFQGCSGFTHLTLMDGVEQIGPVAFANCTGLTGELVIPGSVTSVEGAHRREQDGMGNSLISCFGSFARCSGLNSLTLPNSITNIGIGAFWECTGITHVSLADGLTVLGGFEGCTGLTEIEIPESVMIIGAHAFRDCTELVNLNIPSRITEIGRYAFSGCSKLLKLEWLPGVTVGEYAFQNCSSWQGIFNVPEGVTEIAAGTFAGCSGLQMINLPDGITTIGTEAFKDCDSLTEMRLPQGLLEISYGMFYHCNYLSKVTIPDSVKRIGNRAFMDCPRFSDLTIPSGVTTLGGMIFYRCGIKTLKFMGTTTNIASDALSGATSLSEITFCGELPIGYELLSLGLGYYLSIAEANAAFPKASGGRGLVTWPVSHFMGYTQTNAPTVTIISSQIRENDPEVMDVVYKVNSTKPTVKVRALAFEDGVRSFANVVRPENFIEDMEGNATSGNVGDAVTANVEHTLSWKVSSDWATRLAKVSFEVLATEDDILPLELMTIPGTAAHPETWQISWNYVTADKSFEALLWLYADKDLGLTLQDGVLKNGDTRLCSGATVSAYDALVYIYGKMGFQLLDGDALAYVKEATRFDLPDKSSRQYAYRVVTPAGE